MPSPQSCWPLLLKENKIYQIEDQFHLQQKTIERFCKHKVIQIVVLKKETK